MRVLAPQLQWVVRISERRQITIPKLLRDRFGLNPDVEVQITATEQGDRRGVVLVVAGHSGSAKTKMLLPLLGVSSGVIALQREALPPVPVPATTYCRPSTA